MKVIITGGCGFIGVNVAIRHLEKQDEVIIVDDLSRKGTQNNLDYLNTKYKGQFDFYLVDITNPNKLHEALYKHMDASIFYHLAAQVAVTTSITDPYTDFRINAWGTFVVLELLRQCKFKGKVIYSSTNKVYGSMEHLVYKESNTRYYVDGYDDGIAFNEKTLLDFHSPYGVSKGSAEQYVHDYSRIYGLNTTVFRQSCIYGKFQMGSLDQAWISWLFLNAIKDKPITIYGTGKQVRDILFVDDLIDAYLLAFNNDVTSKGSIYNVGGGIKNTLSLLEYLEILETKLNKKLIVTFEDFRAGDQKIYVSDNSKAIKELGLEVKIDKQKGIEELIKWTTDNIDRFDYIK